jgi:hypothetical protein
LNVEEPRPFHIQWNSGELLSYSLTELKGLGIARIKPLVKLSPNVAYQISEDGSYFTAWIGFRTKALAKAWLIPVKKLVGHLSNLIACPQFLNCKKPTLERSGEWGVGECDAY